jgi:hypothetical protein
LPKTGKRFECLFVSKIGKSDQPDHTPAFFLIDIQMIVLTLHLLLLWITVFFTWT